MILSSRITSERGKTIQKTGNEYILVELSVNRQTIGQVELYYYDDNKGKAGKYGEWLLKWRPVINNHTGDMDDWQIIAQDNTQQIKRK